MGWALVWVLAVLAPGAAADDGEFTCNPAGEVQKRIVCAVDAHRAAEQRLTAAYDRAALGLSLRPRRALLREQRTWLLRRDRTCERRTKNLEGGNAWGEAMYTCLAQSTNQRARSLQRSVGSR